tara:strand:+ start:1320 stop:1742 length:423 start_codon:yes stop_codon:yes gene_type:complete
MKKINRDELRKLINESMSILSRQDAEVDAFIDKIERISNGNAEHPMVITDTIVSMNPATSMGSYLLDYIRALPSMADQYPIYRQRAQRIKDVLLAFLFALNDRHGPLADEKTAANTPYALDFVKKALSVLKSIDYNPRYN